MKKRDEHSMLDALFNIEKPPDDTPAGILFGTDRQDRPSAPGRKRPWQSNKEECPNCGALFPSGGICPGCGLHDEEMPWGGD